ncbi:MAG: serine hydrolase [Gemmatimonadetes bacterium]|nr:serine hydrolase [Gemmatimonadota bacterium]
MNFARLAFVVALTAPAATAAQSARQNLEREIARIEPLSGGALGIAATHLESGRTFFYQADEQYPLASTYKVPIAVEALMLVEQGKLDLDRLVTWDTTDLHLGSEAFLLFRKPGFALSVRNMLETMLILSENNSTDWMLKLAGGGDAVTKRLRASGIADVRVDRPTAEIIANPWGITDLWTDGKFSRTKWESQSAQVSKARRDSIPYYYANDPRDHGSPRGMMTLMNKIWKAEILSKANSAYLLDIMYRCETGANRIKGMLPPDTKVAHKTGTYPGTTNDVGIIDLPDGTHVSIAAYVKKSAKVSGADLERAIAQASRAVYDYFLYSRE